MTQRFSFWEDLSIRENLEFVARLYGIADPQGESGRHAGAAGPDQAPGPACRRIVRRLEAAHGAGGLHAARPANCCCWTSPPRASTPRRGAISGKRSIALSDEGLTVLVSHPLHGRGRTLRPHRLYPERQARGARHGRRGDRAFRPCHLRDRRRGCAPAGARAAGQAGRGLCRLLRRRAACQRP